MRSLLLVLVFLSALAAPAAVRHVILVSVDGLAAYHLLNGRLELPNIRELIARGVWFASSETVFPSVTHPSHTTIVTGAMPRTHGVLSNNMTSRRTGERFHPTNKRRTEIVRVPTLFDAAKRAGLTTAAFYWPETREDPSIDYNLPEVFNAERRADIEAVPAALLEELRSGGVPIDLFFEWYKTPLSGAGDAVLAEAAAFVIRRHKPNLLAIHFVSSDAAQHTWGPHHYLAQAALTNADFAIGALRRAVRDAGIDNETVFFIVADHGFHSVRQEAGVAPAFRRAGLTDKVRLHGGGWMVWVELMPEFHPAEDMRRLEAAFASLREAGLLRRVITPDDMHGIGLPRYEESEFVPGHYILVPDIGTYLTTAPAAALERRPRTRPAHSHGYLPSHPRMFPALVISGAGVKRGVVLPHTHNRNIAPTIAHLLGLELPAAEGSVLREALAEPR